MVYRRGSFGFTFVELLVVVALIAIIAAFAVPQFGRVIDNNRVISTTNSIVGILNFSRNEAVRRGAQVTVTAAGNTVITSLASDNSVIRQIEPAAGGLNISAATLSFRANGLTDSAADVTVSVCAGDADGREVTITPGGRIDSDEFTCP